MTDLPRMDEPLAAWLLRRARAAERAFAAWRERRRSACVRCGRPAAGVCAACGARTCARCAVMSIETGEPIALCHGCSGAGSPRPARRRADPALAFRQGASLLAAGLAGVALLAWWRAGTSGLAAVAAAVVSPAVVLGLVPLAFLIGSLRLTIGRMLERRLSGGKDG